MKTWRYEYKMVVSNLTLEELKTLVLLHPKSFIERYPVRKVNNIYFDTHDLSNYYDSLAGCYRRSKMRFRWYGESVSMVKGSLELKERSGLLFTKTIQSIEKELNLRELDCNELVSIIKDNIKGELNIEFSFACNPVLINSYYRCYYETLDETFRITLDYNLKVFDQRLYNRPNFFFQTPLSNIVILEIKAVEKKELNIEEITNYFPFRIAQNSKYTSGIVM